MPLAQGFLARRFRLIDRTTPLLALLVIAPIACTATSEPVGGPASISLLTDVPSGILDSRESRRVYMDERLGERQGEPIVVQVRDPHGRPLRGVQVTATASHGGSVAAVGGTENGSRGADTTDNIGSASFWWTPGLAYGFQTLTVSTPLAGDLVIRVFAYWPLQMKVNVIFADSVLTVGESTTARAIFTTAAGKPIAYEGAVRWRTNDPLVATIGSADSLTTEPATITAVSPGRTYASASVTDVVRIGSQSSIGGIDTIAVYPICTLERATPLRPGQSVNGLMTAEDCRLDTGAPYDTYRLTVPIGQRVQVDLAGTGYAYTGRYDPYLILLDSSGNWVTGDDWSGGGTSPRITFTAETTTYYLQATSLAPGITGPYTLSVSPLGP